MIILLASLVLNYGAALAFAGLMTMGFLMIFGHAMFTLSGWLLVRIVRGADAATDYFDRRHM